MDLTANCILNREEMEQRRLQAAQELLNGVSQSVVARKFGVSRTTASRWGRALHGRGLESLRRRKAPGRPSRLSQNQWAEVAELFAAGPAAAGLPGTRWTTTRLAQAIESRFGVRYDPDHIGRVLHRLGLRRKAEQRYSGPAADTGEQFYTVSPYTAVEISTPLG